MAVPVMIGVIVGLVVGGAAMALWAASRIGEEAARQFDRGFERGRWLADLSVTRALEPPQRTPRAHLLIPNGTRDQPDPGPALLNPYSSCWHAEVPPTAQLEGIDRK